MEKYINIGKMFAQGVMDFPHFIKHTSKKEKLDVLYHWLKLGLHAVFGMDGASKIHGWKVYSGDAYVRFFLYSEVFFKGEYDASLDSKKPTIFDLGANIGMASLFFKYRYNGARIHAFEADPNIFKYLMKNIDANNLDVKATNAAVWSTEGELTFHQSSLEKHTNLTGSIYSGRVGSASTSFKVSSIKLSNYLKKEKIKKIDLLKMDIEGAETEVLKDLAQSGAISKVCNISC